MGNICDSGGSPSASTSSTSPTTANARRHHAQATILGPSEPAILNRNPLAHDNTTSAAAAAAATVEASSLLSSRRQSQKKPTIVVFPERCLLVGLQVVDRIFFDDDNTATTASTRDSNCRGICAEALEQEMAAAAASPPLAPEFLPFAQSVADSIDAADISMTSTTPSRCTMIVCGVGRTNTAGLPSAAADIIASSTSSLSSSSPSSRRSLSPREVLEFALQIASHVIHFNSSKKRSDFLIRAIFDVGTEPCCLHYSGEDDDNGASWFHHLTEFDRVVTLFDLCRKRNLPLVLCEKFVSMTRAMESASPLLMPQRQKQQQQQQIVGATITSPREGASGSITGNSNNPSAAEQQRNPALKPEEHGGEDEIFLILHLTERVRGSPFLFPAACNVEFTAIFGWWPVKVPSDGSSSSSFDEASNLQQSVLRVSDCVSSRLFVAAQEQLAALGAFRHLSGAAEEEEADDDVVVVVVGVEQNTHMTTLSGENNNNSNNGNSSAKQKSNEKKKKPQTKNLLSQQQLAQLGRDVNFARTTGSLGILEFVASRWSAIVEETSPRARSRVGDNLAIAAAAADAADADAAAEDLIPFFKDYAAADNDEYNNHNTSQDIAAAAASAESSFAGIGASSLLSLREHSLIAVLGASDDETAASASSGMTRRGTDLHGEIMLEKIQRQQRAAAIASAMARQQQQYQQHHKNPNNNNRRLASAQNSVMSSMNSSIQTNKHQQQSSSSLGRKHTVIVDDIDLALISSRSSNPSNDEYIIDPFKNREETRNGGGIDSRAPLSRASSTTSPRAGSSQQRGAGGHVAASGMMSGSEDNVLEQQQQQYEHQLMGDELNILVDDWGGKFKVSHLVLGEGSAGRVFLGMDLENGELVAVKALALTRHTAAAGAGFFAGCGTPGAAAGLSKFDFPSVGSNSSSPDASYNVSSQVPSSYSGSRCASGIVATSPAWIEALGREVALLSKVRHHENVTRYISFVVTEHFAYIITEYVPSGSLEGLLATFGALPESAAAAFIVDILHGLEHLHSLHIGHFDLKLQNVLCSNQTAKLADFGASRIIMSAQSGKTSPTAAGGSGVGSGAGSVAAVAAMPSQRGSVADTAAAATTATSTTLAVGASVVFAKSQSGSFANANAAALAAGAGAGGVGPTLCTPLWASPQLAMNKPSLTSDIWSVGLIAMSLVSNELPYANHSRIDAQNFGPLQFMFKLGTDPNFMPELPEPGDKSNRSPEFCDFIKLCVQRDENSRPSASELLNHKWLEAAVAAKRKQKIGLKAM